MIIDKYIVKDLGEKASDMFCEAKVASLSAAVSAVMDADATQPQVDRVVQSTNQAAWRKISARNGLTARFDPASTGEVMKILNPDEATKLASTPPTVVGPNHRYAETPVDRYAQLWDEMFSTSSSPGVEKTAAQFVPETESNWHRIGSKIEAAIDRLQSESNRAEMAFQTKLADARSEVKALLEAGIEPEIVEQGIMKAAEADPEIGELIIAVSTPEIERVHHFKLACATLTGAPPIVHEQLEDIERLSFNDEHPLVKIAHDLINLRKAAAIIEGASEEGRGRLLRARQLALIGDDPWAHPTSWQER